MKDNFFKILEAADVEVAEEFPTTKFIDSGSYMLDALLSARMIDGGFPANRVTGLAGSEGTGKTFFALSTVKQFLDENPLGNVLYFDSEFSMESSMVARRGIDAGRVHLLQPETLEKFRTDAVKLVDAYEKSPKTNPVLMVLDSLSNLPSEKEMNDAQEGKNVRDMTKAQTVRSIFRVLTGRLGKNNVPLVVCNHTYDVIGAYVPTKAVAGGGGLKYAASSICMLSKSKDKDGTDVVGSIIKAVMFKSRYSKENQKVSLRLNFDMGLDRYYGLLELAEKYDIIKKVTTRYEFPDGSKHFEKAIYAEPEKFFTKDLLAKLDEAAQQEYSIGMGGSRPASDDEAEEDQEE